MYIEIKNLTYIYQKGTPIEKKALDNVSLNVGEGTFCAVIGRTGSGKTSLVQHLNGLLKPMEGSVSINGADVSGKNLKELRKTVGMVFQYPEHQLFEETVFKDISFGLKKMNLTPDEINYRVYEAAKKVGLDDEILYKSPFEISGGQKRRAAIAGVLAMDPKILVLDEPAAGLDPKGRNDIFEIVRKLHKEKGVTIILVSHSMEDVARYAERIIVMDEGKIRLDGGPERIFKDAEIIEKFGLAVPEITLFMKKIKKIMPGINENVFTVNDAKKELIKALGNGGTR